MEYVSERQRLAAKAATAIYAVELKNNFKRETRPGKTYSRAEMMEDAVTSAYELIDLVLVVMKSGDK